MKKFVFLFGLTAACFFLFGNLVLAQANDVMVQICHLPPGNPANAHTITVNEKALGSHLAKHGDLLGPCAPVECEDDMDKCTIDIDPVTLECIPLGERPLVDCDDGSACTADTCDPAVGCQNHLVCAEEAGACEVAICALGSDLVCGTGECILIPKTCEDNEICDTSIGCVPDPAKTCPCAIGGIELPLVGWNDLPTDITSCNRGHVYSETRGDWTFEINGSPSGFNFNPQSCSVVYTDGTELIRAVFPSGPEELDLAEDCFKWFEAQEEVRDCLIPTTP